MNAHRAQFAKGYICAAATLVSQHGADTTVFDLLRCIGNADKITQDADQYDLDVLIKAGVIAEIKRKEGGAK